MLAAYVQAQPVYMDVAGTVVTIPPCPAAPWLTAITDRTNPLLGVLNLLDPDDHGKIVSMMVEGEVTNAQVYDAILAAVEEVSGRKWWETIRLIGWADQPNGQLYGSLVIAGVDPQGVTLAAWCAALYALLVKGRDQKELNQLTFDLEMPPPGYEMQADSWDTPAPW